MEKGILPYMEQSRLKRRGVMEYHEQTFRTPLVGDGRHMDKNGLAAKDHHLTGVAGSFNRSLNQASDLGKVRIERVRGDKKIPFPVKDGDALDIFLVLIFFGERLELTSRAFLNQRGHRFFQSLGQEPGSMFDIAELPRLFLSNLKIRKKRSGGRDRDHK